MKKDKDQKEKPRRKLRIPNFDELMPAIIDGVSQFVVGDDLMFRRQRSDGELLGVCVVKKIDAQGIVSLWDKTNENWFLFHPVTDITMAGALRLMKAKVQTSSNEPLPEQQDGKEG
jgi:hypothetical protein